MAAARPSKGLDMNRPESGNRARVARLRLLEWVIAPLKAGEAATSRARVLRTQTLVEKC